MPSSMNTEVFPLHKAKHLRSWFAESINVQNNNVLSYSGDDLGECSAFIVVAGAATTQRWVCQAFASASFSTFSEGSTMASRGRVLYAEELYKLFPAIHKDLHDPGV